MQGEHQIYWNRTAACGTAWAVVWEDGG